MALNVLFTSAIPYLPQIYGGLEINTHELISELLGRGHRAAVLTRLAYGNAFGLRTAARMRITGEAVSCDHDLGYPVYRTRTPWTAVGHVPRPDIAVVQDGGMIPFADALARAGTPVLLYLHGLEFESWAGPGRLLPGEAVPRVPCLANSAFTAARFHRAYGRSATVIPPVCRPERYRTTRTPRHVTFVNPVPEKGLAIALALAAACPDIPFLFVKGWPLTPRAGLALARSVRRLPNVTLRERTRDMREIYATTRVLLAPSVWENETWGRVASEAQCSGIPVLASDRGGLPESVGAGGTILPVDAPPERWRAALRRLWDDPAWYAHLSRSAEAHARRSDLQIVNQMDRFLAALAAAARPERAPAEVEA